MQAGKANRDPNKGLEVTNPNLSLGADETGVAADHATFPTSVDRDIERVKAEMKSNFRGGLSQALKEAGVHCCAGKFFEDQFKDLPKASNDLFTDDVARLGSYYDEKIDRHFEAMQAILHAPIDTTTHEATQKATAERNASIGKLQRELSEEFAKLPAAIAAVKKGLQDEAKAYLAHPKSTGTAWNGSCPGGVFLAQQAVDYFKTKPDADKAIHVIETLKKLAGYSEVSVEPAIAYVERMANGRYLDYEKLFIPLVELVRATYSKGEPEEKEALQVKHGRLQSRVHNLWLETAPANFVKALTETASNSSGPYIKPYELLNYGCKEAIASKLFGMLTEAVNPEEPTKKDRSSRAEIAVDGLLELDRVEPHLADILTNPHQIIKQALEDLPLDAAKIERNSFPLLRVAAALHSREGWDSSQVKSELEKYAEVLNLMLKGSGSSEFSKALASAVADSGLDLVHGRTFLHPIIGQFNLSD